MVLWTQVFFGTKS